MDENGTYSWSANQQQPSPRKNFSFQKLAKTIGIVLLVLVLVAVAGTCFYTVDD